MPTISRSVYSVVALRVGGQRRAFLGCWQGTLLSTFVDHGLASEGVCFTLRGHVGLTVAAWQCESVPPVIPWTSAALLETPTTCASRSPRCGWPAPADPSGVSSLKTNRGPGSAAWATGSNRRSRTRPGWGPCRRPSCSPSGCGCRGSTAGASSAGVLFATTLGRLAPELPARLDGRVNPEVDDHPRERVRLLDDLGMDLFQEKQGFTWRNSGAPIPPPSRLRFATALDTGRDLYRDVMARAGRDTLDRNDGWYRDHMDEAHWAAQMMEYLQQEDSGSWLVASDGAGDPVGMVAVSTFDPGVATVTFLGVVPEHRGQRLWARPAAGGHLSGPRPGLRGDALRRRHAEPADDRYHAQCRPSRRGAALAHLALPGRGGDTRRPLTRRHRHQLSVGSTPRGTGASWVETGPHSPSAMNVCSSAAM